MTETTMARYAEVLISAVNLQEGQCLSVACDPVQWEFVSILGRAAYRRGARYVQVEADHDALYRARVDESREEYLSYVPEARATVVRHYVDDGWARIVIAGKEDPDALSTLDARRNGIARRALSKTNEPLRRAAQTDRIRWTIAAFPTPGWAAKIFGTQPTEEAQDRLWAVMEPILRLDQPDPIAAWLAHAEAIGERERALCDLELDSVRFEGPGTDLTIGLPKGALWVGGGSTGPDGFFFLPNLPTEEVFTAPDFRRTHGEVTLTRPALILGRLVDNAWFRFDEGRVVECRAETGQDTLEKFFEVDEQSRFLGEVALVDGSSPIYQSGLVFHNTLFDENAACHIAFGSAYPGCIPGGEGMDDESFKAAGGNRSLQHADVMIGGPKVTVFGIQADGGVATVMENGSWKL